MYVVTLSVFHNLAIWLLYVNKPEPEKKDRRVDKEALRKHRAKPSKIKARYS